MLTGPGKTARLWSGEQLKGGCMAQSRKMVLGQAPQRGKEKLLLKQFLQYTSSHQPWEFVSSGQPGPTDTMRPGSQV